MIKVTKIMLVVAVFIGTSFSANADRGIGRKNKSKVNLNIRTLGSLKNDLYFNLRSGLKYTGSFLVKQENNNKSNLNNTLITYQKGNTIYIVPYKQKVVVSDIQQGYTGMKVIIRSH